MQSILTINNDLQSDPYLRKALVQLPQDKWSLSKQDINTSKHMLESIGIVDCFEGVIRYNKVSNTVVITAKKFQDILKETGEQQPIKVLYVDNDINNIKNAKEAGLVTVHVLQGSSGVAPPNIVDFQIDTVYHFQTDLKDLRNYQNESSDDNSNSFATHRNEIIGNNKKTKLASESTNLDKRHVLSSTLIQEVPPSKKAVLPKPTPLVTTKVKQSTTVSLNNSQENELNSKTTMNYDWNPPQQSSQPERRIPVENIKLNSIGLPPVNNATTVGITNGSDPIVLSPPTSKGEKKKKKKKKRKIKEQHETEIIIKEPVENQEESDKKRVKKLPPITASPRASFEVKSLSPNGNSAEKSSKSADSNSNNTLLLNINKEETLSPFNALLNDLNLEENESKPKKKLSPIIKQLAEDDPFKLPQHRKKQQLTNI
ncbi:hypothetical protein ABK040_015490 [Willaertia magna]